MADDGNRKTDSSLMPPPSGPMVNSFPLRDSPQRVAEIGARRKIALQPGHSPMDWANLKDSGKIKQVSLKRFTLEEIQSHNKKTDCWIAYNGKIYDVTEYIPFHPGGSGQLMRGAGKDASELIRTYHSWVNVDIILDKCFIGYLVKEHI
jgi:cytochrome b involved in lipid metabolism